MGLRRTPEWQTQTGCYCFLAWAVNLRSDGLRTGGRQSYLVGSVSTRGPA
jgi:hypothetical protein